MPSARDGKRLRLDLNYKGITLDQCRQQTKLFKRAFQYLIKPSWQLAISQLFLSAIPLTTFFFSVSVNLESVIAVGIGISLCNIIGINFCYALATASEDLAAAKNELSDVAVIIQRGLFLSLSVLCFPIWAIWINSASIFSLIKQQPTYAKLGEDFCFMFLPGLPIFILVLFLQKYMYLIKQTSVILVLLCNLSGAILNIGLNAAFVISLKMGVRGSALATVLTYLCLALLSFLCIMWKQEYRAAWPGWQWSLLLDWGQYSLESLPYFFWISAEWWTLDIGIYVVGALLPFKQYITSQILLCFIIHFLSMIANQFTFEAADQIKDAVHSKYKRRAIFITKCSVLVTWLASILCGCILAALNYMVPAKFLNNRPFSLSTAELIVLVCPIPFLKGTQAIGFNLMRKMGAKYTQFIAALVGYWIIALPVGICLVFFREWGVRGIWTGYTLGLLFQAIFFLVQLKGYLSEWMADERNGIREPLTPSGTLKHKCPEFEEIDGGQGQMSLLLAQPRLHIRINSVEASGENDVQRQRSSRPSARVLIRRSLLFCISSSLLVIGLVVRNVISSKRVSMIQNN